MRYEKSTDQFEIIEERAAVIRFIFTQADKGFGKYIIASQLQEQKIATWGTGPKQYRKARKWHPSYIDKILNSGAVIGQYQPHEVVDGKRQPVGPVQENYYPRIVPNALYARVRGHAKTNRTRSGRVGSKCGNLFTHLVFCGQTKAPAVYSDKGKWRYLSADARLPDGRKLRGWPYEEFESFFLNAVGALDLGRILGERNDALLDVELQIGDARMAHSQVQKRAAIYTAALEGGEDVRVLVDKLRALQNEEDTLLQQIRDLESQAAQERSVIEAAGLTAENLKKLVGQKDPAKRRLLRQEIRRVVTRIDIFFRSERTVEEQIAQSKFLEKVKYLRAKGAKIFPMSPLDEARSINITFVNGASRLVVEGADGQPVVATDVEGNERVKSGYLVFEPGITPPNKRDPRSLK